jgi:hypothetical protein
MRAILALLLLVAGSAARAQCPPAYDWSGFYPPAILDRAARLTAPDLQSNFEQYMLPRLTDQQRRALAGVSLDFSRREYPEHPLNFYAARGGKIVLPLSSIRLVTDLTLALAWLNRHRLPEKKVFDYAAMLAYRGPTPDGVRALPLAALGIPENAASEANVGDLFQKVLVDTMVFIMAHEMGHLFHNHQPNVGAAQSRLQESEADAFAVELMGRMGVPPIGISYYFTVATPFECPARSTHPLTGERVNRLAATLRDNAALFVRDKPSPQHERQLIEAIARELEVLARLLDDPDIRESTRLIGQSSKVADFSGASASVTVPGVPTPGTVHQAFDGNYVGKWTDAKGTSLDFRMTLQREGSTVRGNYEFGMGAAELEGTVEADQLDYAWRWGKDYFGRGKLKSLANGELQGTWGYTRRFEGGGTLSATRR